VTGTIALVVTGTPGGDLKVRIELLDGRPVEIATDPGPDPELTLTVPAADARAIRAGTLDPSVAFMRGRLKTAGDNGLLLGLLAATADPSFGAWLARWPADPAPS
jgi:putative sterol carrier protein